MINPGATSISDIFLTGDGICDLCGNSHIIVLNDPIGRSPDTVPCPLCIEEGRLPDEAVATIEVAPVIKHKWELTDPYEGGTFRCDKCRAVEMGDCHKPPPANGCPIADTVHLYNDHTLKQLRELSKVIEFADQIQISGRADKVAALLTCATAVPDLLARIEQLERKNG